jgi:hypothetical protein
VNCIREPVKYAVAYYFFNQKWLSKEFLDGIKEPRYGDRPLDSLVMDLSGPMDVISTAV